MRPISYQKDDSDIETIKTHEELRLHLKNKAAINAPPPPSPLTSPSSSLPSPQDKIAHWRLDLISALKEEISQKTGLRRNIVNEFLERYNSGSLLPETFKNLEKVSWQTLYRWWKAFNDYGIDGLIPQYGGEGNSKATDHEKNFLLALLLNPHCLTIGYTIKLLKNRFKNIGLESPSSPRTLRRFADEFKKEHPDVWTLAREGEKALDDKFLPYIPRDRNFLKVGDVLVADGHRMNLLVTNPFTGDPCRPVIVFFIDWRSNFPLGWEIMLEESTQCIASAARNAILTLGKIPKIIYVDNGKAFKSRFFTSKVNLTDIGIVGIFAFLKILITFTSPYNAKAKINERFHRLLNEQFECLFDSYVGPSIEDKPAWTKRNEKLARSLHNDRIPKISEVNENLFKFREFYIDQPSRGLDGKAPREIFESGKGPGIDSAELTYLMMEKEIKTIHRNGFTLFGCDWYDKVLYGYREPVLIKYSLFDLSQIYVFTIKGDLLCVVKPIPRVHPMAHELGTPKDMEEVKRQIAQKRKLKKQTIGLYRLLDYKASEILPWKEIVNKVPSIIETIEKIEAEKPATKFISPFVNGVTYNESTSKEPTEEEPKYKPPQDWNNFAGDHWERFDYHMKQEPGTLSQDDLDFIEWYKTTTEYQSMHCSEANLIREEP